MHQLSLLCSLKHSLCFASLRALLNVIDSRATFT
nr:MAG TPA_asm: hypothetical protein [Caudoviricetes sp.]